MKRFLKHIFFLIFIFTAAVMNAQPTSMTHKVVAGETVYGISHKYGLTEDELRNANPNLIDPGFGLKAGDVIVIPAKGKKNVSNKPFQGKTINIGVMLPLNETKDGKNMVEYYRGILMACDYLKREKFDINVHAWDVNRFTDVDKVLKENGAAKCDIIFGPYYSSQVSKLSSFSKQHDIRLVVPFAPGGPSLHTNKNLFVLGEFNPGFNEMVCNKFFSLFKKINPIIIDCNDAKNAKGDFTMTARHYFDKEDIKYNITNLNSSNDKFIKAFKKSKNNIVILNSSGSNEFKAAAQKIKAVRKKYPKIDITVLGYNEWFLFEKYNVAEFAANNVYIPTFFYYNAHSSATKKIEADYYRWFKSNMQNAAPRYAIAGYDHANFFIRGLNKFGKSFDGSDKQNIPGYIQMPLHFKSVSAEGGHQNTAFMFIHYKEDQSIESIAY